MTCDYQEQYLLYLWGEMDADQARAFAEHLERCPSCQALIDQHAPLAQSISQIQPEPLEAEFAARVNARFKAANHATETGSWFGAKKILAVAASILLLVGGAMIFQNLLGPLEMPKSNLAGTGDVYTIEGDENGDLTLAIMDELAAIDTDDLLFIQIDSVANDIDALSEEMDSELNSDGSQENDQSSRQLSSQAGAPT